MDEISRTVQRCLRRHLGLESTNEEIDMKEELVRLGLDSMSAISLLVEIEQTFSITFPEDWLQPQTFRTGELLLAAVRELVAGRAQAAG